MAGRYQMQMAYRNNSKKAVAAEHCVTFKQRRSFNKTNIFFLCACLSMAGLLLLFSACDDKKSSHSPESNPSSTPASGDYTFTLVDEANLKVWTSPVTHITEETEVAPEMRADTILICAAANEYEPFQIALSGSGSVTLSFSGFDGLADVRTQMYRASFTEGRARALALHNETDEIELGSDTPALLWFDSYIPKNAEAGTYKGSVKIAGAMNKELAVELTVFDFALPDTINFNSHLTVSMASIKADGDSGDCEKTKTMLYEHRMTVKGGQLWPTGFSYNITWPSGAFTDEPGEGVYGVAYNAPKYLKGEGWTRPGYPLSQAFQFVDNSTPRPDSFNGVSRGGDHYGTAAYNTQWKNFLGDLNTYIKNNGYADKLYYYVINEPQDQDDYDLAAYLCKLTKEAAPDLKIAVSEEPKAEIAENSGYPTADGKSYDIWIADIQHYEQTYAWKRQKDYGEEVWFYHNDGTPDPFINPIEFANHGGLHQRLIPWLSWHYRVTGWAYYNASIFFDNKMPNIRGKLLREGFEDYEYLRLANNASKPQINTEHAIDATVNSAAQSTGSYAADDNAFMKLKWQLGQYVEGSLDEAPVYTVESSRPAGSYYINFQNLQGEPSADPLVVDGREYIKADWSAYDSGKGYGWVGGCVGTSRTMYCYDDVAGYNELQKSALYDDYGKVNLFEFDLAAGTYSVTVGVGRAGRGCYDKHNVSVEGVEFLKQYESSEICEVTKQLTVTDGKISLQIGDAVGQYTFVAYMKIETTGR